MYYINLPCLDINRILGSSEISTLFFLFLFHLQQGAFFSSCKHMFVSVLLSRGSSYYQSELILNMQADAFMRIGRELANNRIKEEDLGK